MKVSILDDYMDTVGTLDVFTKLDAHDVTVWTDHVQDVDVLVERLADTEALVLIRERTPVSYTHLPDGTRVAVAGVVTHRQRPETARGITFVNLEDETGLVNVICSVAVSYTHLDVYKRQAQPVVGRGHL